MSHRNVQDVQIRKPNVLKETNSKETKNIQKRWHVQHTAPEECSCFLSPCVFSSLFSVVVYSRHRILYILGSYNYIFICLKILLVFSLALRFFHVILLLLFINLNCVLNSHLHIWKGWLAGWLLGCVFLLIPFFFVIHNARLHTRERTTTASSASTSASQH